jgi:hypothetical protein
MGSSIPNLGAGHHYPIQHPSNAKGKDYPIIVSVSYFYLIGNDSRLIVIGISPYKAFFYKRYCPHIHFLTTSLVAIMPTKVLNHRLDNRINNINAVDVGNPTP